MSQDTERLYQLLPTLYRRRDAEQGEPLRALLGVLDGELSILRSDVARLYDSWFIETCDEWLVPYIADLLGVRVLQSPEQRILRQRTYIANTLSYRRRKGTVTVLEGLAQDVTGWPAKAAEFFQLLATSQCINLDRPHNLRTPNLRTPSEAERQNTPFESIAHTTDVRSAGRYALRRVGVFLYRLNAYQVALAQPTAASDGRPGCYRFSQLGHDLPLYNPRSTGSVETAVVEGSLPQPLRRSILAEELAARRQALSQGRTPQSVYFDEQQPALQIFVLRADGVPQAIASEKLFIADLSSWQAPITLATNPDGVAIDPERGRFLFAADPGASKVLVTYHYGFSSELGGGPYDRHAVLAPIQADTVVRSIVAPENRLFPTEDEQRTNPSKRFVIELGDNRTYTLPTLRVCAGVQLEVRAKNLQRPLLVPTQGKVWQVTLEAGASLTINGVLLAGGIDVNRDQSSAPPSQLTLVHCTLVPGLALSTAGEPIDRTTPSVAARGALQLTMSHCISGALALPDGGSVLSIASSVVDSVGGSRPCLQIDRATITRCTLLGSSTFGSVEAFDTLFCGDVSVRNSDGSQATRSFLSDRLPLSQLACQPALALSQVGSVDVDLDVLRAQLRPGFSSVLYGTPEYAQLRTSCPAAITRGGSDDSEMGAFHHLYQGQRRDNLVASLQDYLRFGLDATIYFQT